MKNDRLYILMRRDMASLNPGKAVAQGSHAATKFLYHVNTTAAAVGPEHKDHPARQWMNRVNEWLGKRGFGTKICLAPGGPTPGGKDESWILETAVKRAVAKGYPAGLVKDPSYPLKDGSVTHLFPVVTCAYIFGDKEGLAEILEHMSLMA